MTLARPLRLASVGLALVSAACLIGACGSSSSSSSSSSASAAASGSSSATASRSQFRACLQAHGVNLPARPGGAGGGPPGGGPPGGGAGGRPPGRGFFGGGGGAFRNNPKLRAAIQACGGARFRGRFGGRRRFTPAIINRYVSCVRSHGYNLPKPNLSGRGPVFPAGIRTNPKFMAASRPCQSLLFAGPGGSGSSSSSSSTSTS